MFPNKHRAEGKADPGSGEGTAGAPDAGRGGGGEAWAPEGGLLGLGHGDLTQHGEAQARGEGGKRSTARGEAVMRAWCPAAQEGARSHGTAAAPGLRRHRAKGTR